MNDDYPDKDFPWNFYFNGEVMPKWGACWGSAGVASFLKGEWSAEDLTHRDIYIICCQIDHVGSIESADPGVFIYAIQEVLHILLSQRAAVLGNLSDLPPDVYSGMVEAAFRMRELAVEQRSAFWTSGYEADRVRLVDVMTRCQWPPEVSKPLVLPHLKRLQTAVEAECAAQVRRLHQLAQSEEVDKSTRKRLLEIRATKH